MELPDLGALECCLFLFAFGYQTAGYQSILQLLEFLRSFSRSCPCIFVGVYKGGTPMLPKQIVDLINDSLAKMDCLSNRAICSTL
jgi:hypothetical protein